MIYRKIRGLLGQCDHEWKEEEHTIVHPNHIFYDDEGLHVYRQTIIRKSCNHCWATEHVETKGENVYLEVSKVEEAEME